jgi:hypothetical protein
MSELQKKWIGDNQVGAAKIRLENDSYLKARNNADSADVNIMKVNTSDALEFAVQPKYASAPVANEDLANKGYILDVMAGLRDPKDAVELASTGTNLTLSGEQTIDGVLTSGTRILVKDQTTASENGIYVTAAGAWSRAADADSDEEVTNGMSCLVTGGNINARKLYVLTTSDPITVGVTNLTFAQAPNPANFLVPKTVTLAINATDVSNGYKDLAHEAENESISVTPKGGPLQEQSVDYTLSVVSNVTRITFAGDLASKLADGDDLLVSYQYATS